MEIVAKPITDVRVQYFGSLPEYHGETYLATGPDENGRYSLNPVRADLPALLFVSRKSFQRR